MHGCKRVAMLGQTFVYRDNTLCVNDLRRCEGPRRGSENPSESLVESGLRHLTGKTFRAGLEDAPPDLIRFATSPRPAPAREGWRGTPRPPNTGWVRQDLRRGAHVARGRPR